MDYISVECLVYKCETIGEKDARWEFPGLILTSSDCLFCLIDCPKPKKDIPFTMIQNREH